MSIGTGFIIFMLLLLVLYVDSRDFFNKDL